MYRRCVAFSIVVAAIALSCERAVAIPVFARIYDKPCGTCHTVFPQLNPAGELFRAKGLHGIPPAVKPLRAAKELELPGTLPVAVSFAFGEDVTHVRMPGTNSTVTHFNLNFISLLAGGELGPHLAFLADYAPLFTNPRTGEVMENTNIGMGFLQGHAEVDSWLLNLRAGVVELPLGTSPRVHRLSVQPYLVYSVTALSLLGRYPPEDRLVLSATQLGAEVSGLDLDSGWSWAAGITNGSNNEANGNAPRDAFLHLGRGWGLHRAGMFLYYSPDLVGSSGGNWALRVGPDMRLYYRRASARGQFLASYDSNPAGNGRGLWYYGTFVEGEYRFLPSLASLLRVEYVWMPTFDNSASGGASIRRQLWQLTGGVQWLLLENLKAVLETTYGENHEDISDRSATTWTATARIVSSFWLLTPPGLEDW